MSGSAPRTASAISSAVVTFTRSTPPGVARLTGPATSRTRCPAAAAAAAIANPILPDERLLRYRTGSIGSRVGPAVTSNFTRPTDLSFLHLQPFLNARASS